MEVGSSTWNEEAERFRGAVADRHRPPGRPRRTQDRTAALAAADSAGTVRQRARHRLHDRREPPMDRSRPRDRAIDHRRARRRRRRRGPCTADRTRTDPSDPAPRSYRYVEADSDGVERAVAPPAGCPPLGEHRRRRAPRHPPPGGRGDGGRAGPGRRRHEPRRRQDRPRGRPGGVGGRRLRPLLRRPGGRRSATGSGPTGWWSSLRPGTSPTPSRPAGSSAALAAGNAVILKPAPETVLTAARPGPAVLGRRRARRRAPVPALRRRRQWPAAHHPSWCRRGRAHRRLGHRPAVPRLASRAARSTPRRAARTPS